MISVTFELFSKCGFASTLCIFLKYDFKHRKIISAVVVLGGGGGECPIREFFTHIETSTLTVNDCKFGPILGTRGHLAMKVL